MRQRLWKRLIAVPGVLEGAGSFGNDYLACWVNGKEIAHFHGDDLELRLTRQVIRDLRVELKSDPRVRLRPSGADWITVSIRSTGDVEFAVELAERAASAHRAPKGTTPKPPPTGPDLARRRRFH